MNWLRFGQAWKSPPQPTLSVAVEVSFAGKSSPLSKHGKRDHFATAQAGFVTLVRWISHLSDLYRSSAMTYSVIRRVSTSIVSDLIARFSHCGNGGQRYKMDLSCWMQSPQRTASKIEILSSFHQALSEEKERCLPYRKIFEKRIRHEEEQCFRRTMDVQDTRQWC